MKPNYITHKTVTKTTTRPNRNRNNSDFFFVSFCFHCSVYLSYIVIVCYLTYAFLIFPFYIIYFHEKRPNSRFFSINKKTELYSN